MFGFGPPPAPPKLVNLLDDPNPNLQSILAEDSCIRAYRQNYSALVKFINERAADVLECALSNDSNALRAYQLFGNENDSLLITISNTPKLLNEASQAVFNENPDEVYINRFAHITELIALKKPSLLFKDVDYVEKFFPYIHLRAVYGIFESCLVPNELSLDELQNQMRSSDFLDKLLDYLKSLADSQDPLTEGRVSNIYKLISLMATDKCKMEPEVQKEANMKKLLVDFTSADPRIQENKWQAISDVLTDVTTPLLTPAVDDIIGFLDIENACPQQVIAINLLKKLALKCEDVRTKLQEVHIEDKLISIIQKFPQYTFAHIAIKDFCLELKDFKELSVPVIKKILGYGNTAICDDSTAVVTRALIWKLVAELKEKDEEPLTVLNDQAKEALDNLDNIYKAKYGGEEPEQTAVGEDALTSLTPEQIMTLLRFLTSSH